MTALVLIVGGLYLGVCGLARASYRSILYPAPGEEGEHGAKLIEAKTSDGTLARAIDCTEPGDETVLVWFHGNGENAAWNAPLAIPMRARGFGSVFVEYRGYGVSRGSGRPTEEGLYADAAAILDALDARGLGARNVVLVGYSLGTGVAAEMAARGRGRALVLMAPFTSVPAVAGGWIPFLPTSLLIGDKFDTLSKTAKITVPTTIIHGTRDEVVPFSHGETLARALDATFIRVENGHHADLFAVASETLFEAIAARARKASR